MQLVAWPQEAFAFGIAQETFAHVDKTCEVRGRCRIDLIYVIFFSVAL
jgi:hypothetical protein